MSSRAHYTNILPPPAYTPTFDPDHPLIETWRAIPGHQGYEVSDQGRVRHLPHIQHRAHPKTGIAQEFRYAARILKPVKGQYGYLWVNLDGKQIFVHRLVLLAFVGPQPEGHETCHGNGDRGDNRLTNLRWGTKADNFADRERHGTINRGATHPTAKFPTHVADAIRAGTLSAVAAKERHGVSQTHFYRIKRGDSRRQG
jgi:hypothetical protein